MYNIKHLENVYQVGIGWLSEKLGRNGMTTELETKLRTLWKGDLWLGIDFSFIRESDASKFGGVTTGRRASKILGRFSSDREQGVRSIVYLNHVNQNYEVIFYYDSTVLQV